MFFLIFLNTDVQFVEKELKQKSYIPAKVLPTTKRVELINKREFAAAALEENAEMFLVYVASLLAMQVYPSCQAQVGPLLADKAPAKVLPKYLDYADVFSFDLSMKLPENIGMNKHVIELVEGK